ncbi:MAG: class I SAM-dependent methyltransferase [Armatimonadota bacterium]
MRLCRLRLRMCVRWRWALIARLDLPAPELSRSLAQWLQGPRSRALRRAGIGRRERVLEVGCGHGFVTEELGRRAAGEVVAVDAQFGAFGVEPERPTGETPVARERHATAEVLTCQGELSS